MRLRERMLKKGSWGVKKHTSKRLLSQQHYTTELQSNEPMTVSDARHASTTISPHLAFLEVRLVEIVHQRLATSELPEHTTRVNHVRFSRDVRASTLQSFRFWLSFLSISSSGTIPRLHCRTARPTDCGLAPTLAPRKLVVAGVSTSSCQ